MSAASTTSGVQHNQQTPGVFQTFRALRHRDFRLLWVGLAVSAIGTWMQIVAQSLLVLKITHGSAFDLGTVSLAQALAFFLFALVGGSVADRLDKRRLLIFTQSGAAALAILLGFLTLFGVIRLWMVLVLAFLNGTLLSFDQPARGALVPVLVPKEDIGNAISLQAMLFNGASILGPALAGFGVAILGFAGNFFLNGASFLAVLIALFLMRVPSGPTHQQSTIQAIRTALGTVRRDAVLPWVLSGYAALLFLGPSSALILPVYAVKILHVGPERLGMLFSAAGFPRGSLDCGNRSPGNGVTECRLGGDLRTTARDAARGTFNLAWSSTFQHGDVVFEISRNWNSGGLQQPTSSVWMSAIVCFAPRLHVWTGVVCGPRLPTCVPPPTS